MTVIDNTGKEKKKKNSRITSSNRELWHSSGTLKMSCFFYRVFANVCLCFQGTLSKSIIVMLLRLLTQPKKKRRSIIWIYISAGHRINEGGGLDLHTQRKKKSNPVRPWCGGGGPEESFLHTFFVGPPSSVNGTVFQAHYLQGRSYARHVISLPPGRWISDY